MTRSEAVGALSPSHIKFDVATLFFPDALQLDVVMIKRETAWIGDVHGFHRDDDIVASEIDRARPSITETVLPGELRRVSVDFACASRIRRGVVAIGIGRVECNLERVSDLMNAELEHALSIQKFLVHEFALIFGWSRGHDCSNCGQRNHRERKEMSFHKRRFKQIASSKSMNRDASFTPSSRAKMPVRLGPRDPAGKALR